MDPQLSLILGGVRSGKSGFAEKLVRELDQPTLYLATGVPSDPEMEQRIRRHRESRPSVWDTLEEPVDLAGCLKGALASTRPPAVVLVDSLDVWVSNLLLKHEDEPSEALEERAMASLSQLLQVWRSSQTALFLVSGEVGLSLVPPNPLGRRFQDLLGLVNQKMAGAAGRVYLVVSGIPIEIKGEIKGSNPGIEIP